MFSSPSSSTSTLVQKPSHKSTPKDYESALASLQSSYGFASAPIVSKKRSSLTSSSSSTSSRSTSVSAPASTTIPKLTSEKDYEAALASMQSSYGFGGAPMSYTPNSTSPSSHDVSRTHPAPSPSTSSLQSTTPHLTSQKNYASAFATLSASYGFGSSPIISSPPPSPSSSHSSTPSKPSRLPWKKHA